MFTGRRRSQGAERASIRILERDSTGLIKINPLANWSFKQVKDYIDLNKVPYNALLDQGYTSIGDWHSTVKSDGNKAGNISVDAAERAGRWAGRKEKTECGLHKDCKPTFTYGRCNSEWSLIMLGDVFTDFKMKMAVQKKQREAELAAKDAARDAESKADAHAPAVNAPATSVETHQLL